MQKIISLFERDYEGNRQVVDKVVEGAEWVQAGEGVATQKWDGTACMVRDGILYKRLHWKEKRGPAPSIWEHWDGNPLQRSGHGWMPIGEGPEDHLHRMVDTTALPDGTYELCGPKIQNNPENLSEHMLIGHGDCCYRKTPGVDRKEKILYDPPRTFNELREWFKGKNIEGIVWYHPDGRMVKIKKKDFGLKRRDF